MSVITCCPKCGGTSGFTFTIKLIMFGLWGESAEASDTITTDNKQVTCEDCGTKVSRKLAERS